MKRFFALALFAQVFLCQGAEAQICNTPSGFLQAYGQILIGDVLQLGPDCNHVVDGGSTGTFSAGSIPFGSGLGGLTQNNADLFWDSLHDTLGVGTNTPYPDNNNAVGMVVRDDVNAVTRLGIINRSTASGAIAQLNLSLGSGTGANISFGLQLIAGAPTALEFGDTLTLAKVFGFNTYDFENETLTTDFFHIDSSGIKALQTTASSSSTTGSGIFSGGVGIAGNLNTLGTVNIGGVSPNESIYNLWVHTGTNLDFLVKATGSAVSFGAANDAFSAYVPAFFDANPLALNSQSGGNVCVAESACGFPFEVSGNANVKGHLLSSNASVSPTVSSCGTGTPTISGGDTFGTINTGGGALTSCVLNFGVAWGTAPRCVVSSPSAIASLTVTASTSQLTIGGTSLTSSTVNWHCGGAS